MALFAKRGPVSVFPTRIWLALIATREPVLSGATNVVVASGDKTFARLPSNLHSYLPTLYDQLLFSDLLGYYNMNTIIK